MTNRDPTPPPSAKRGGMPPLAWLIVAALVLIGLVAFLGNNGARTPPSGGPAAPIDTPQAPNVIDAAPVPPVAPTAPSD